MLTGLCPPSFFPFFRTARARFSLLTDFDDILPAPRCFPIIVGVAGEIRPYIDSFRISMNVAPLLLDFFFLIQDFSIKIVFTCCNSISYSIRPSHFYVFTRKIFAFISHFRLCVSPSFVNGMNSSYFFSFFPPFSMKFYFQFNSGTGDQTEKNHASLRSFNIFLSIVRLHPFSSPSPASF